MAIRLNNTQIDSIINKYKINKINQNDKDYKNNLAKVRSEINKFISDSKQKIKLLDKGLQKFLFEEVGRFYNGDKEKNFFKKLETYKINSLVKKVEIDQKELSELKADIIIQSIDSKDLDDLLKKLKITI